MTKNPQRMAGVTFMPRNFKKVGPDCQSGRSNGKNTAGPRLWRGKQGCLPRLERGPALFGNSCRLWLNFATKIVATLVL